MDSLTTRQALGIFSCSVTELKDKLTAEEAGHYKCTFLNNLQRETERSADSDVK